MERLLSAWGLKSIQEALNIQMHLAKNGKSWADVKDYLEQVKRIRQSIRKDSISRHCPDCGRLMRLYPVNNNPRCIDRIGTTDFEDKEGRRGC